MASRDRNTLTQSFGAQLQPAVPVPLDARVLPSRQSRDVVALSSVMVYVLGLVRAFAAAETVVFEGPAGTGKSYLAQLLHESSGRRGAFVDVSAGEFEPGLALDQLFGHVRGAFTGALSRHRGLFAEAEGGTLLIDEFHLLRRSQQAMLIRALERRVYRPIGYERDVPVTCTVVVGVEEGLDRMVARGRMRANLRSRLGQCIIRVPTLDERREEIAVLAHGFLRQCREGAGVSDGPTRFAPDALAMLELATYPANLRDLREVIKAAYLLARGEDELGVRHTPRWVQALLQYDRRMDRAAKQRLVEWALRSSGGHIGKAAVRIGVHRNTVAALAHHGKQGTGVGWSESARGV